MEHWHTAEPICRRPLDRSNILIVQYFRRPTPQDGSTSRPGAHRRIRTRQAVYARTLAPMRLVGAILFVLFAAAACATSPAQHPSRIALSSTRNLRDLGGYATLDGRHVKGGLLFRSDNLGHLEGKDLERFAALGLKTIFDLRSVKERESKPTRFPPGSVPRVVEIPLFYQPLAPEIMRRHILGGDLDEGDARRLMKESYRAYALNYPAELSTLLRGLAEPGVLPALIHCTHGKDRTGVAVAVILRSLGVPQETVLEDYLLSNVFWESEANRLSCLAYGASFFRTPREEVRALLEVRPEYLEAAFTAINERYGSFATYLHEGLGIDSVTLERLRAALLD